MLRRSILLLLAPLALAFVPALAAVPTQDPALSQAPGRGQFDIQIGARSVRVWTYHPERVTPDTRIVLAHHGASRTAEAFLRPWVALGDRYGCIVLSPEFSTEQWPGGASYNLGFVQNRGEPVPEQHWAFSAPDQIFDHYKQATGNRTERYFIWGHSAGGQFVHRMVWLKPFARYEVAAAANAGYYTMPDLEDTWPYGLKESPRPEAENLKRALERRVVILLGDRDNDPNHSQLPRGARANAQGPHRFARGQKFFAEAQAAAERLGAEFNWATETVPGVAHSHGPIAPIAARYFFGPPPGEPGPE